MGEQKTHFMRGLVVLLVLGVPCVVAGILAALAAFDFLTSGWLPQDWYSDDAADWIFGAGAVGDGARYLKVLLFGGIACVTGLAIRWGFKG